MTFYEEIKEYVEHCCDIQVFNGETKNLKEIGHNLLPELSLTFGTDDGDVHFYKNSSEVLVIEKDSAVMEMLNEVFEQVRVLSDNDRPKPALALVVSEEVKS